MPPSETEILVVDGDSLGNARNKGIARAAGDYLFFIDADDYLFPDTLFFISEQLKRFCPDVFTFNCRKVGETVELRKECRQTKINVYASKAEFMLKRNFLGSAWSHIVRRELIDQYGIRFKEGVYHEDEAFTAKVHFHAAKVVVSNLMVYAYYQNRSSILHRMDEYERSKRINDFREILSDLREYLSCHAATTSQDQQEALKRRIRFLTIDYLRQMYRNKCSWPFIHHQMKLLRTDGFLPLPVWKYSTKYTLVSIPINILSL